jgi:hypothetical protein
VLVLILNKRKRNTTQHKAEGADIAALGGAPMTYLGQRVRGAEVTTSAAPRGSRYADLKLLYLRLSLYLDVSVSVLIEGTAKATGSPMFSRTTAVPLK